MNIACNIITSHVRQLAINLGITDNRAVNLVTYWQSEQQGEDKGRYPTAEELKSFMDKNQEKLNDIYTAVPQYEMNDDLNVPIRTREDGVIEMKHLPKENSIQYFYNLFEGSPNLENIKANVTSFQEAYRFMLYKEMEFNQLPYLRKTNNHNKAEIEALKKIIEYKRQTPKNTVKQSLEGATPVQYTPVGQKEKTVYIKGNHIYNSKGEEIYKGDSVDRNKIYAKYSLKRGESVIVEHKGSKYIVNKKNQILSVITGKIMQMGEENGDSKNILNLANIKFSLKKGIDPTVLNTVQNNSLEFYWAATSDNNYEVSTKGDSRFSALVATFKPGTSLMGIDVGGKTIEFVYQNMIKKSRKGAPPAKDSILYNESLITKEDKENFSYYKGYLPLWQEWAKQNPGLIEELREKANGKTLTDQFAYNTSVSQARALAEILNNKIQQGEVTQKNTNDQSLEDTIPLSKATENKILEYRGYFEGGGATLNTVPTELMNDVAGYFRGISPLSEERAQEFLQYISMDPNQYALYSGGAEGADTYWGTVAQSYGMDNITHYRPEDITDANRKDAEDKINQANSYLNRVYPMQPREATETKKARTQKQADYYNGLILRDTLQASSADAIFAIGQIKGKPTSDGIIHKSQVEGGTGWAVQIGINQGKPVYVFDQVRNQWYKNEGTAENRRFVPIQEAPKLTNNFAGIGTEHLNDKGRQAIKDVFIQTFGYAKEVTSPQSQGRSIFSELTGQDDDAFDYVNTEGTEISSSTDIMSALGIAASTTNGNVLQIGELAGENIDLPRPNIKTEDILQQTEDEAYQAYQTFTPQKMSDRCNMLYQIFDDVMSDLMDETLDQLNEDLENADFEQSLKITDRINALEDEESGRHSLLQLVPFGDICNKIKERLLEEKEGADSEYDSLEYDKVLDNFSFLMSRTCRIIEDRDNIRIIPKKVKNAEGYIDLQGIVTKATEDVDIEDDNFQDNDEGQGAEHSGIPVNIKLNHPSKSISKITKSILQNIPEYGRNSTDDLGWTRYMKKGYTHAILLNELSKMVSAKHWYNPNGTTLRSTFPALAKIEAQYPWVYGVMNRLHGDENAISAFFSDMYMPFIKQGKVTESGIMILNDTVVADSMIKQVQAAFESKYQVNEDKTIWTKQGTYRIEVLQQLQETLAKLNLTKEIEDSEERKEKAAIITDIFKSIGIVLQKESVNRKLKNAEQIQSIIGALSEVSTLVKGLLTNNKDVHIISEYKTVYSKIAEHIGEIAPLQHRMTFREGGKDYPNYSVPSEIDIMIKELTNPNKEERNKYIEENFKDSGYLYDPKEGRYRIKLIQDLLDSEKIRQNLEVVTVRHSGSSAESLDYKDWSEGGVYDVLRNSYFIQDNVKDQIHFAYYPFPIFSDTEAMVLIKLPSYRTTKMSTFKDKIKPLLKEVVEQELYRIHKVQQRRKDQSISKIVNYDKNGDRFFFIPQLNDYTVPVPDETGQINQIKLLDRIAQMNKSTQYTSQDIDALLEKAIEDSMNQYFEDYLNNFLEGELIMHAENALRSRYKGNEQKLSAVLEEFSGNSQEEELANAKEVLEEYFWNYCYAQTQIIQLSVTDPAFYKDDNGVDFQKRFKQLTAAGHRLNTQSKYGRKTSYNIVTSDNMVASHSYIGCKNALQIAVDRKWISKEYMDAVLEGYLDINAADGQGIRSISSFKSVLHMLGKMTTSLEEALDNFENGTPTKKDFLQVLQVIKPFQYGSTIEEDGLGGTMRVGRQIKNSEMPLLSGLAIVAKGILGNSPFFNALHEFMEEHSIDTLQFESCIKTGGQGIVDLHFSNKKLQKFIEDNEEAWKQIQNAANEKAKTNREKWESGNKELIRAGKITQEEFNRRQSFVKPSQEEIKDMLTNHIINEGYDPNIDREDPQYVNRFKKGSIIALPYEKMMIAQPTPEHLFDTKAKIGSQLQNIIPADLPDDIEFNIHGIKLDKQQFLALYDSIFVENKLDAFLNVQDKFNDPVALSNMLLEKVQDNPKYGRQYQDALRLVEDPNNPGQKIFNVGLDFPSMRNQIAELMLSTFKKAVTVQDITGGNAILTSSFIFTDQLKTEFKEDGGIKCAPCYLPAHSRKFYEPFMDENGIIDIKNIPVELREMISYRIPTEGKYSSLPIRVVGFLPSICGSAIMLPVDISYIAGEDYDVDKRFLMIPAFRMVNKYNYRKAEQDFFALNSEYRQQVKDERKKQFQEFLQEYQKDQEQDFTLEDKLDNKETYLEWLRSKNLKNTEWLPEIAEEWKKWWGANKANYITGKKAVKIKIDLSKIKEDPSIENIIDTMLNSSKEQRDNLLIDLMNAVLTHPLIAHQIVNPGHFNNIKRGAKTGTLLRDDDMRESFMESEKIDDGVQMYNKLKEMSISQLATEVAKYSPTRPLIVPSTFVYNHQQNMTAGKLIGNYANNTTSQTKLQTTDIGIAPKCQIVINGRLISSASDMYTGTLPDGTKQLISKNCSETSAASVDDVKDPNLKQLSQNPNTAKILGGMLRAGLQIADEASLFFQLPLVYNLIQADGDIKRYKLESAIAYLYDKMQGTKKSSFKNVRVWTYKNFGTISITTDNLVRVITKQSSTQESLKVYLAFYNMVEMSEYLSRLTMNSRQDSPNGSIAHTLPSTLKQVMSMRDLHLEAQQDGYPLTNVTSDFIRPQLLQDKEVTRDNKKEIATVLMTSKMRRQQAAYTFGIEEAKQLVDRHFAVQNKYLQDMLLNFSIFKPIPDSTINAIQRDFVQYLCTKTDLLGDTEEDSINYKEEYYKKEFPTKGASLADSIQELKDNPTIQSLSFGEHIQLKDSARLSEEQKQQHMDNLDRLLTSSDPKVIQFAEDLFMHTFYADGFNFGSNSIGNLFSVSFINKFKEVRDLFRQLPAKVTQQDVQKFTQQLIHSSYAYDLFPSASVTNETIVQGDDYSFNITKIPTIKIDGTKTVPNYILLSVLDPQTGYLVHIPAYLASMNNETKQVTYTMYRTSSKLKFNAKADVEQLLNEAQAESNRENIKEEINRKLEMEKDFQHNQQSLTESPNLTEDPYKEEDGQQELVKAGGKKLC